MIFSYIAGSVKLSFRNEYAPQVFGFLNHREIPFEKSKILGDHTELYVPLIRKKSLSVIKNICTFETCGLPALILKYRKRWGIAVGTILFLLITYISGRVIWTLNITGNCNISDEYIREVLSRVGCREGAVINQLDFAKINNAFLAESEGIAWISVNIDGTHANVELRETMKGSSPDNGSIFNIVAAEDGQIERLAQIEGKPQVSINDVVKEGDILVSGAIVYHENLLRYESACGSIYAYVTRDFQVEVPFRYKKKVYTGRKIDDKSAVFFKNNINLFTNYGIPYKFYDTIYEEKNLFIFGETLPLGISKISYREYTEKNIELTIEQARNEAIEKYRNKLTETLGKDELLEKTVSVKSDNDKITIKCSLYCLADIAEQKEIKINNTERADKIGTKNSKNTEQ